MMRRARRIVLWGLGALLLTVSAAFVFLAAAGDDFYRWALRQAIEGRLDREIRVDGSFSFDVGLEPALTVTELWVANADWAGPQPMARADRVEIQLAMGPLFAGIVRIPKLVVEGLDVDLETSADGEPNWDLTGPGNRDTGTPKPPLLELISLKDIDVTYDDRRSGWQTEVQLDFLDQIRRADDASLELRGEGRVNRQPFRMKGKMGSIEDALAATKPYPLEFVLQSLNTEIDLTGTAENLPAGEGFALGLNARISSLDELLDSLQIDIPLSARAEMTARLQGDLEALAAENISIEVIDAPGQSLRTTGRIANLTNGQGLDLRVAGEFGPEILLLIGDMPAAASHVLAGVEDLTLSGRVTGDLEALALDDLHAQLEHDSGASLALWGDAETDLSGEAAGLAALDLTAQMRLPDRGLLEQALGTPLPDLGAVQVSLVLAQNEEWITINSAEIELQALEGTKLSADGRIGRVPGPGFAFELDPQIDLSLEINRSRPLVYFLEKLPEVNVAAIEPSPALRLAELAESLPELGPASAALRLSRENEAFRFDDLNIVFSEGDSLQGEIMGSLGLLRPERDIPFEDIALAVGFSMPSTQPFSSILPSEVPEFRQVTGRFDIRAAAAALSISNARIEAEGPDGLVIALNGGIDSLSFEDGIATTGLAVDLDARWPDTPSALRIADLDPGLPDLGPVWARATLEDRSGTFTLTGIDAIGGPPERPVARMTGEVGDLAAMKGVDLSGEFDLATATLLGPETVAEEHGLGNVQGRFHLSDMDGSLGLEALSAEIEGAELLSLSVDGVFDDIRRGDDLVVAASLEVPDMPRLGREFGFDAERFSSLSFEGNVSGSDELFRFEGRARLGETDLTGSLSGTLTGERPVIQAKLASPLFRLGDVGLGPRSDTPEATATDTEEKPESQFVFGERPIPFDALRRLDLELDVLLEDLEGIRLDLDRAEAKVHLADGVLQIDPLSFDFVGGRVDMSLLANAREEVPELHLKLEADDVNLGDFLVQTDTNVPLDGELDLVVDLKGTGTSPRALASSLHGDFDLALERGRVHTGLLRLTTANPIGWLFTESARRGYSEMNCLILRFDVDDGLAEGKSLLLDTPNILAVGEGGIDLRNELIDIRVGPQAKQRKLVATSTPFAIRGPLADPSVEVSTAGASVRMASRVLLSPVNLLGSLLPFVNDDGRDTDNPCLTIEEGLSRQ